MKLLTLRIVSLACAGLLVLASQARADAGRERVLQRGIDPVTGAQVSVFQGNAGLVGVEVVTPAVRLRKQLAGGKAKTVMTSGREQLAIEFDRTNLVVTSEAGRVEVTPEHPERADEAKALIARSRVAAAAAALIGKMGFGADSPTRAMLLSTRALLLSASGDPSGTTELARWAETARTRVRLTRVALQDSPTDCWNKYAAEAIAAYMEYEDCMRSVAWWDILTPVSCAVIYDMRALGAFSWWIRCVSFGA